MIQVIDRDKENVRRLRFRVGFIAGWLRICMWDQ
jgi:hypothetical protein